VKIRRDGESANVIRVVDLKPSTPETSRLAVRNNEFPQNVNFAIKSSVAQTFLETPGTRSMSVRRAKR